MNTADISINYYDQSKSTQVIRDTIKYKVQRVKQCYITQQQVYYNSFTLLNINSIYLSIKNASFSSMERQKSKQQKYTCPGCGRQNESYQIKTHIKSCKKYQSLFLNKIKRLDTSEDFTYLKFLNEELDLAKQHIEKLLNEHPDAQKPGSDSDNSDNGFDDILDDIEVPLRVSIKKSRMSMDQNLKQDFVAFDERDIVQCNSCSKKFYSSFDVQMLYYVQQCWHLFCKPCIRRYIDNEFVNMGGCLPCPAKMCRNTIPQYQIKATLGQKFQSMQSKALRKMYSIIECFKCKQQYDFAAGNPNDAPKKDLNGKMVKPQHAVLYAQNRFMCPKSDCKTEQCKQCQATPYHLGMTCKQFKSRALLLKCRYCDQPINQSNNSKTNIEAHTDICNSRQCQKQLANSCTKMLQCGHPCCGVKGQKICLPCLRQGCCQKFEDKLLGQKGDDYCAICYVESLTAAPTIQCGCGHLFHLKCIKKRFQIKWLTPRILFNFCLCPLCKKWIDVPQQNQLLRSIDQNKQLFAKIQKMALERLKFEELEKDQKLVKKQSQYYNKPNEYSMAIYAYFMCFKCKKPYFGGRKNCAEAMNQQNVDGFKAEQLICPGCCDVPVQNCPKHGKDFIQFKCKYCCSTAQWFCWGNTHFCDPCHKRQCAGDYVSKYTKDKLPKCGGPGTCPVGGNHDGNGQQKMLGCAICRNYKQNHKGF